MFITFRTHASPNVVMPEHLAHRLLDIIGKPHEAYGVITAAELENSIAKLEIAISIDRKNCAQDDGHYHENEDETEEEYDPYEVPVGLAQRAFPFLEMLRAARAEGGDIIWGI